MTDDRKTLRTDTVLRVLSDPRRREMLRYLVEYGDEPVSVDELLDGIAPGRTGQGWEYAAERRRIRIDLVHRHLPKLAEDGIVEYDPRSATVRYRRHEYLEAVLAFVSGSGE